MDYRSRKAFKSLLTGYSNVKPHVAALTVWRRRSWDQPGGRKLECIIHKRVVATCLRCVVDCGHESVIQVKDIGVFVQHGHSRSFLQGRVVIDRWVVDLDTLDVVELGVILIQHFARDVRDVLTSIACSRLALYEGDHEQAT